MSVCSWIPGSRFASFGWQGRTFAAVSVTFLGLLIPAFSAGAGAEALVVAATPDLKSLAEAVSGGAVRVESLVPPGADPEAFEPRPSHVALVRDAALVMRIGLGYD